MNKNTVNVFIRRPTFLFSVHHFAPWCLNKFTFTEDIYVEDASRVETIGWLLMEKFDLFKKFKENPDAHCIVSYIVNSIVRAASGGNTRGIG